MKTIYIDDISNIEVRKRLKAEPGAYDTLYRFKYEGNQTDYALVSPSGETEVWTGGDITAVFDSEEAFLDSDIYTEIINEWAVSDIEGIRARVRGLRGKQRLRDYVTRIWFSGDAPKRKIENFLYSDPWDMALKGRNIAKTNSGAYMLTLIADSEDAVTNCIVALEAKFGEYFESLDSDYRVRPRQRSSMFEEDGFYLGAGLYANAIERSGKTAWKVDNVKDDFHVDELIQASKSGDVKVPFEVLPGHSSSKPRSVTIYFYAKNVEDVEELVSTYKLQEKSLNRTYLQRGRQRPASHSPQVQEAIDAVNRSAEWVKDYIESGDYADDYVFIPFEGGGRAMEFYDDNLYDELGDLMEELGIGEDEVKKAVLDIGEYRAEAMFYPGAMRANERGKLTVYQTPIGEYEEQLDDDTVELLEALTADELEEVRRAVDVYMSDRNLDLIYLSYDYDCIAVFMPTEDIEEWLREKYTPDTSFYYFVDLDERGEYRAHVEDAQGNIVWEADTEEFQQLVEDGFLKFAGDLRGTAELLADWGLVPKGTVLEKGN